MLMTTLGFCAIHCPADVLVINANPLLNVMHSGDYTPGSVNRVATMNVAAEGKGVNVARFLARPGTPPY